MTIFETLMKIIANISSSPAQQQPQAMNVEPKPFIPPEMLPPMTPPVEETHSDPVIQVIKKGVGITTKHLVLMGASQANADKFVDPLNYACERFGINSYTLITAFMANVFNESGALKIMEENLHYTAENLMNTWPKSYPNLASTVGYVNNPIAIANRQYAGIIGNKLPNDGWDFRGRGLIQLTGRENYRLCGIGIGVDLIKNPEILFNAHEAALSAAWYFGPYRKAAAAALPGTPEAFKKCRIMCNGGVVGLKESTAYWNKANIVFADLK